MRACKGGAAFVLRTLVLHAPLELGDDGLARQIIEEGLRVHWHLSGKAPLIQHAQKTISIAQKAILAHKSPRKKPAEH